jgi:predicted DsbA family dithiol-disulfide isomerase
MKIDFISDLTCPWCAIGLANLEQAIARLDGAVPVELGIRSFELNPDIAPEGEDIEHYAARKYGATPPDVAARQALIRSRAADAGLTFPARTRVWNTFDGHRLLHWARSTGRQLDLKRALLAAYHVRGENPAAHEVLLAAVATVGLDVAAARRVLAGNEFAREVRDEVEHWRARGLAGVPAILFEDHYLLRGGQSVAAYEQALRQTGLLRVRPCR